MTNTDALWTDSLLWFLALLLHFHYPSYVYILIKNKDFHIGVEKKNKTASIQIMTVHPQWVYLISALKYVRKFNEKLDHHHF